MNRCVVLLAVVFSCMASIAQARPAHKQALAAHLGPFFLAKVNDCRLCHVPGEVKPDEDKPRNAFGESLEAAAERLEKDGKPAEIPDRFTLIENDDADGDGISNLIEVLAGSFPGDAVAMPNDNELKLVEKALNRYRKFLASYPWKPFESVERPAVPRSPDDAAAHPIDAFLAEGQRDCELVPRARAEPGVLIRRLTIDLTGLPPSAEEVADFERDSSSEAYAKLVDRLLASPQYGERWGRHWMDVWRYSDWAGWTGGNSIRDSQPHIWRWRDWIVESINKDKPYDRMIVEMLAGDEVTPSDPATLRATGYLARNFKASRERWMTELVDHTFLAFQGLTIGCARCHDHFYDPILQTDYYQVRAVFEPHELKIDAVPGEADTKKDGLVRAFDAKPDAVTYLLRRGDERNPDTSKPLTPGIPKFLGHDFPEPQSVKLEASESTGRRTALAKWLIDRNNPLTARVAVNHIWLRHFGQALVPSVFDFGKNGRRPLQPALLDWLAAEFVESGWSMKHLHRLIVTSAAYQRSSTPDARNLAEDRDNAHYWRVMPRRVEAEVVRDSLLQIAGKLDLSQGGADIDQTQGLTVFRRSLYFRHAHEKQMEFLTLFDAAGVSECYQRRDSIVPQQALALANSSLAQAMAAEIATQIQAASESDRKTQVELAFRRILGRSASNEEQRECLAFLVGNDEPAKIDHGPTPPLADKTDGHPYELASEFKVQRDTNLLAVRFFKSPSEQGEHVARIWSLDGKAIAEAKFADTKESGWQTAKLSAPAAFKTDEQLVVSVNINSHYPYARESETKFNRTGPAIFVKGRYGEINKFPTGEFGATYFVDVVCEDAENQTHSLYEPASPTNAERLTSLVLVLFNHHEFVTIR